MIGGPQFKQGYAPLYRRGVHCPVCDSAAWHIGRLSAQCASCHTPLAFAPDDSAPRAQPERLPAWARRA